MKILSKKELDAIKIRLEKNSEENGIVLSDYRKMRDTIEYLTKENDTLKSSLFNLSQDCPEDKKWENILASKIELSFIENNAKEFLEINNSINNQTYTIIIQKKFGKTPKQLLDILENRKNKTLIKYCRLKRHTAILEKTCRGYNRQINNLINLLSKNFKNDNEVLKSRENIELAIKNVQNLVYEFNSSFIEFEASKLHKSFSNAYHEQRRRASIAEHQVKMLKNEIKDIKRCVLQKKYPLCRIYKGNLKSSSIR